MKRALAVLLLLAATVALGDEPAGRNEHDDDFVDAMILHHRHGIALARLAAETAQSPELRGLAQQMIATREQDIRELRPMRDNGEEPVRAELSALPGMDLVDIRPLEESSGEAFDARFVALMRTHLGGGIELARYEIACGADSRPKRKARAMLETQTRERDALAR